MNKSTQDMFRWLLVPSLVFSCMRNTLSYMDRRGDSIKILSVCWKLSVCLDIVSLVTSLRLPVASPVYLTVIALFSIQKVCC